ncbi:MobF family relaxase [Streptomyces sp. NPDC057116]|uniref:MobF family relaxase n=1 Tax=Streptomyces sp. NPDC057116 TaxID=3346023 RepID=UPI00363AF2FA
MHRYYLRETVVGDGRRPARTPLYEAQEQAGVPAGRWMGRGLAVLGLAPGEEVTEAQLRNLFGERGRHPYADRIEADRLAVGDSPKKAYRDGALGRRVTVAGVDFVFRPQPTIYLLWALGDEETRLAVEAVHERAIERVLEWIEDEVAVIRYGKDGIYRVLPPGGLVAARFRHYEARSGRPLLHDHLLLSVKGQRLDGKWGSIHTLGPAREHGRGLRALQRAGRLRGLRGAGAGDRAADRHPGAPDCDGDCRGAARADPLDCPAQ